MKTKVTLILSFLIVLMALGLVYQGQVDGLTSTPAARANTDHAWAFPTPAAGRNAEIVIEVKDLAASVPQVRNIVSASGGQVVQSDLRDGSSQLLLTVPSTQFEAVFTQLHALTGTVTHEAVTPPATLQDLATVQAQIDVLAATDGKLRQFLAEAKTPEAVLKLESQLLVVQQELTTLRSLMAQQQLLASTVTVTVTIQEAAAPAAVGAPLEAGLETVTFLVMIAAGLLGIGVAILFGRLAALRTA